MLEDWQYDGSELRKIVLNNREKQYVLGTILGTSSLIWPKNALNPHLQMRESKNKGGNWLRCKAEELKRFSRKKSFIFDSDSFRWNSVSDTCWIDFYNLCLYIAIPAINIIGPSNPNKGIRATSEVFHFSLYLLLCLLTQNI